MLPLWTATTCEIGRTPTILTDIPSAGSVCQQAVDKSPHAPRGLACELARCLLQSLRCLKASTGVERSPLMAVKQPSAALHACTIRAASLEYKYEEIEDDVVLTTCESLNFGGQVEPTQAELDQYDHVLVRTQALRQQTCARLAVSGALRCTTPTCGFDC